MKLKKIIGHFIKAIIVEVAIIFGVIIIFVFYA